MKMGKKLGLAGLAIIMLIQGPMIALTMEPTEGYEDDSELALMYETDDDELEEDEDIPDEGGVSEGETLEPDDELPIDEADRTFIDDGTEDEAPEEDQEDEGSLEALNEDETGEEDDEIIITARQMTGVTVTNNVNFRRGPSSSETLIGRLSINTTVRITGHHGTWYRIVHDGTTGWVAGRDVQETRQTAIVSGDQVPVRSENNANATVLTHVANGTIVLVERRTANWARVSINHVTGWIPINQLTLAHGRRPGRTRNGVALRQSPHASSSVVRNLPRHQELMVVQRTTNGTGINQGFTQVAIRHAGGTITGWVSTNQIEQQVQTRRTRGAGRASVRRGPGESFSEARTIGTDTAVTVLAEAGAWSHVSFTQNGTRHDGWIANHRLTRIHIQATTTQRRTGVTVMNNVNFRRGPSHDYAIRRQIPVNTNVRITGRRGTWYRIVHNGTTGWVTRQSVQQTRQIAVVRANNAPVRASRNANGNILTRATRGTRVTINQRTANWAQVTVNNRTGWIRTTQLTLANGRRPGRTRGQVNLRVRPNASSTLLSSLPRHQELMILQRTTNGGGVNQGWTQVRIRQANRTQTGWIRTNQVEQQVQIRRTTGSGQINVRTGPGSSFARIGRAGRIPVNMRITVLAESGAWSHVRFNRYGRRHYGWIATRRLARSHNQVTTLTNSQARSYLALVNQDSRLSSHFSPHDLRVLNVASVNGTHRMRRTAASQAESLFQAAARSGHTLFATSGYRSYATQRTTHNHWINVLGPVQARRVSARPGHSEHQLGLALDISTPGLGGQLSEGFSQTAEGRWLRNNAHRFGFIIRYPRNREADTGFAYEPWHIRYVGVNAATVIFNRGLILEEFLGHQ